MKRVNLIYEHPIFQEKFQALQKAETDRPFCNHTLEHLMDVARLMYIYSLEHGISISKEIIYATALMHDIGRIDQIEKGIPHEKAGAALCDAILPECGFVKNEIQMIQAAILRHRTDIYRTDISENLCDGKKSVSENELLSDMLYWADKKSRNCFACRMREACNWDEEKMNLAIEY